MIVDRSSADEVQKIIDAQASSWSKVEASVSKIGETFEGITRAGLGLAGLSGIGAIANNFMATSQAGSNLGLAAGHVTGGMSPQAR